MATSAALLTHLAGGGALPGWLGVLVPWALSLAMCTALAGRRPSLWRTTVSVALSQVLFHTLFVLGTPVAPGAPTVSSHLGHRLPPGPATPSVASPANLVELLGADPAMWWWHGIAAAATVAAVYGGERALLRLCELAGRMAQWVRRRLTVPASVVPPHPVVRVPASGWFADSFSVRPERSPLRRRGPPRALAA